MMYIPVTKHAEAAPPPPTPPSYKLCFQTKLRRRVSKQAKHLVIPIPPPPRPTGKQRKGNKTPVQKIRALCRRPYCSLVPSVLYFGIVITKRKTKKKQHQSTTTSHTHTPREGKNCKKKKKEKEKRKKKVQNNTTLNSQMVSFLFSLDTLLPDQTPLSSSATAPPPPRCFHPSCMHVPVVVVVVLVCLRALVRPDIALRRETCSPSRDKTHAHSAWRTV